MVCKSEVSVILSSVFTSQIGVIKNLCHLLQCQPTLVWVKRSSEQKREKQESRESEVLLEKSVNALKNESELKYEVAIEETVVEVEEWENGDG